MTITATTDIVVQLSASRDLLERQVIDPQQRAYSTGNRQKVALIAAFATQAPVLRGLTCAAWGPQERGYARTIR